MLSELTSQGTSLLLTTQYIEEAERLAGTIVITDHGTVIASGTPGQLQAQAGGDRLELQSPPGQVVLPVTDRAGILLPVTDRLAAAGLRVSALAPSGSGSGSTR